jgi:hypothetical protein
MSKDAQQRVNQIHAFEKELVHLHNDNIVILTSQQKKLKCVRKDLKYKKTKATCLFAINADMSPYSIVKERIHFVKNIRKKKIFGTIEGLLIDTIYVPYQFKERLGEMKKFNIHVNYGTHYEPWISAISCEPN